MVDQIQVVQQRITDRYDNPVGAAQIAIFTSGTAIPAEIFSDEAASVPMANPVIATDRGTFPQIFFNGNFAVRAVVSDANGGVLEDIDPAPRWGSSTSAAGGTSFSPIPGNTATNVQDAIENATGLGANTEDQEFTGTFTLNGETLDRTFVELNTVTSKLNSSAYTAVDVRAKLLTVDGAGSGVDADLLDGQHGSYYRNASNIDAGTLAEARLPSTINNQTENDARYARVGTSPGGVGTYAFLRGASVGTGFNAGTAYAGSGLRYYGTSGASGDWDSISNGGAVSGTWECMGDIDAGGSSYSGTLFYRTA